MYLFLVLVDDEVAICTINKQTNLNKLSSKPKLFKK